MPWGQPGGHADNTEAIERTLAIAVRYALQPAQLASAVADNAIRPSPVPKPVFRASLIASSMGSKNRRHSVSWPWTSLQRSEAPDTDTFSEINRGNDVCVINFLRKRQTYDSIVPGTGFSFRTLDHYPI